MLEGLLVCLPHSVPCVLRLCVVALPFLVVSIDWQDTEKLKSAATAYAKGEGGVDEVKKAATDTVTSYAQGLMK